MSVSKASHKGDPTARLSKQQKAILRWMANYAPKYTDLGAPGLPRITQLAIPWDPSVFIGKNPTASQSSALSASLKKLEDRGLIERRGNTKKQSANTPAKLRTLSVNFTYQGQVFAKTLLSNNFDAAEYTRQGQKMEIALRLEGLRLAETFLDAHLQGRDIHLPKFDLFNAWQAVHEARQALDEDPKPGRPEMLITFKP